MFRWILLLIPHILHAQNECVGTHSVTISDRRPYFTDKTIFEQQLLANARIRLVHQTLGTTVQQTIRIYQEGSRTVYKIVQSSTTQEVHAKITNECYNIVYRERTTYITLSGTPVTIPVMSYMAKEQYLRTIPYDISSPAVTPEPISIPRVLFLIPFYIAYVLAYQ